MLLVMSLEEREILEVAVVEGWLTLGEDLPGKG